MKVLVTGGTGFTGKALVRRMLDEGHQVVALDNKEGHKTAEIRDWGAEVVIGTVTDMDTVRRCVAGVEVVHHVAAAFRDLHEPEGYYYEVNVGGTRNLLQASLDTGVRKFVYCSTCGVHGNVDDPPGDENSPIRPHDYYQKSKYEAEPIVLEFNQRGLESTILRPNAIFGPGDPGRFYMIFKQLSKGWFPMFGGGQVLYHPLYIDNFLDAFVLAMRPGAGAGQAYLIADEEYTTIEDLVRRAARAMGQDFEFRRFPVWPVVAAGYVVEALCKPFKVEPPLHPRRVDWYRQDRAFRIDKARRDLGYQPKVGLDEGLRRACEWYRSEGMLPARARGEP
jgi:2-alkyl-3-oxoalkanoate reductase